MKKTTVLAVFFIFLLSLLSLTACTNNQSTNNANNNRINRRPDFGQPERQPDVSGVITAVIGNEVTVLKMERQQRNQDEQGDQAGQGENGNNQPRPANLGATLNGGTGGRGQMRFYGGGRPGGGQPGEMDEDSRAAMLERLKEMSSGEEKIIIPVGIRMLKPDTTSDSRQPEMLEATLTDINTDKMIQVWLDGSVTDRKVAEFVLVMR